MLLPFSLNQWIDEHRDVLKPPVGNKMIFRDSGDYIVMAVGGPNIRTDYHFNQGEEFFYQLEGDMTLKVIDRGEFKDIPIRQGDIFLLPQGVPHSPQRPEGTIGLVIEKKRPEGSKDGLMWYCSKCQNKLYEEFFYLDNVETQFPPVFDRYYNNPEHTTCKKCGTVNGKA